MNPISQLYVMIALFLSTNVPSVAAFSGIAPLMSKPNSIQKSNLQLFDKREGEGEEVFARMFRHSLSPLDEKVAAIRESCYPLVGMTIKNVAADCQFRLRCANVTHEAIFFLTWANLDKICSIGTELEELAEVDERAHAAHLREEQERQRLLASYLDMYDGIDHDEIENPIDSEMVEIANYQRKVMPAVGATIHGVYLGGGHIMSLGNPPTSSVHGWTDLFFDLGDDGWLSCHNAFDENGYDFYSEKPKNTALLHCTGTAPTSVESVGEKKKRIQDAVIPLIGKKIEYFETIERFSRENNTWEADASMPVRIFCSNQTVFSFGWWKADSIQVAECESPEVGLVSLGDLILADAAAMPLPEHIDGNPSNFSSGLGKRWKRNGIKSIMGAVGRSIQGAGLTSDSLRFDLGDNNWLEVYNDLGKNGYAFYNEKPASKDVE